MSVYAIQDKETGTRIDIFDTLEEAERTLEEYEEDDIKEGAYMAHFYEILHDVLRGVRRESYGHGR